jgi:hypothetical protein
MKWSYFILKFIEFEKEEMPALLVKKSDLYNESNSKIQAAGIAESRIQNLAITLDKIKYLLRKMDTNDPPLVILTEKKVNF